MKNTRVWTAFVRLFLNFFGFPSIIRQSLKKARGTVRSGGPTTAVSNRPTDWPDDGREINTCALRPFPAYRNRGMGGTPLHYRVIRLKADSAADRILIRSSKVATAGWRGEPRSCGLRPAAERRHVHKILFRLQPPIRGQQVGDVFVFISLDYQLQ